MILSWHDVKVCDWLYDSAAVDRWPVQDVPYDTWDRLQPHHSGSWKKTDGYHLDKYYQIRNSVTNWKLEGVAYPRSDDSWLFMYNSTSVFIRFTYYYICPQGSNCQCVVLLYHAEASTGQCSRRAHRLRFNYLQLYLLSVVSIMAGGSNQNEAQETRKHNKSTKIKVFDQDTVVGKVSRGGCWLNKIENISYCMLLTNLCAVFTCFTVAVCRTLLRSADIYSSFSARYFFLFLCVTDP